MRNANLDTLYTLQQFLESSGTYICEDVNTCVEADISALKFLFWIYFSQAQEIL